MLPNPVNPIAIPLYVRTATALPINARSATTTQISFAVMDNAAKMTTSVAAGNVYTVHLKVPAELVRYVTYFMEDL
jgi:hypothetical protein